MVYLDRVPLGYLAVNCSRASIKRMFYEHGELGYQARARVRAVGQLNNNYARELVRETGK